MLRGPASLVRQLVSGAPLQQARVPPTAALLHSHSSIPRGRAGIQASSYRQRRSIRPPQSASSSSKPTGRDDDPYDAEQEKERQRIEAIRSANERWPSWLPKPGSLAQAMEESQARQKSRKDKDEEEVEQIFIPRDSRQHSSQRQADVDPRSRLEQEIRERIFGQRGGNATSRGPIGGGSGGSGPPPQYTWPTASRSGKSQSDNQHWIHTPGGRAMALVFVVGGGIYYVVHLEQVPYTGRRRFRDVSESEEADMGKEAFEQVMSQYRGKILPANHQYSVMARRVATRIIRAAEDLHGLDFADVEHGDAASDPNDTTYARDSVRNTKWQVFVINDPSQTNAFVLPGGQIFVFTGILSVCGGEDGLATVLGHEVSHKLCNHTAEKTSGVKIVRYLGFALALAGLDWGISNVALQYLMSLPNSRRLEVEADDLGLKLMSRACFDPEEAPKLW
ncbi:hypothetical protein BCV69DRAFT_105917 [Microstroma glucosiphilum]|uniref:Peptidase M48 domain-containing protein n=1 Tax=Pseudomicrostroma glucosiphilum TaxID=1684307 RepID=A0A316UDU6_9BASI|nr:hypothetical protein BCV69DRAFT_105917 [Pseudomicrostroma glucosiphilum]PWN23024.1 hypothetical protein BCV69DRAFT_105917 [Pseudomicrostroma glucosiphilum]